MMNPAILVIVSLVLRGLLIFLLFIIIVLVVIKVITKELEPDCNKGFSYLFIGFLIFMMFFMIFDILLGLLSFPIEFLAFLILSISMEIYLFHKKSKWKFGILAIVLLIGSFILRIVETISIYFMYYDFMTSLIISLVANFLINLNFIIIAIVILVLLKKTVEENATLKKYTGFLSAGVVFLFIIYPIFTPIINNSSKLLYLFNYPYETYLWIFQGATLLQDFFFIIGIIFLTLGAIKTITIPLTFSKEKRISEIQREVANRCPRCDVPILPGGESDFCTNCGHHF